MRALVLALLVLNLLLFGWNRGWLPAPWGAGVRSEREPERLARQVRPDAVRVVPDSAPLPPGGAEPAAGAEPGSPACLEAGPFGADDAARVERALAALPDGAWRRIPSNGGVLLRIDAADASIRSQMATLDAIAPGAGFSVCEHR